MIVTFIPAAGQSTRMQGQDKLLQTINGIPILRRTAETAINATLGPVLIGLDPTSQNRRNTLKNLNVTLINVENAHSGMSETLKAGAHHALTHPTITALMILLPDMPDITTADLKTLANAHKSAPNQPIRATTETGDPGHPTIFPKRLLPQFDTLTGDTGAASLLKGEPTQTCPLHGTKARLDLDTPKDWATWRKATNTPH